jgi:hypothetical protein
MTGVMPRMSGKIAVWFDERRYGFVYSDRQADGGSMKLFLHADNIVSGKPEIDKSITFDVSLSKRGALAVNAEVTA